MEKILVRNLECLSGLQILSQAGSKILASFNTEEPVIQDDDSSRKTVQGLIKKDPSQSLTQLVDEMKGNKFEIQEKITKLVE